jgi:flagellin
VNRAADDAAGLGVATTLKSQSKGMRMAMRNANDGISIIQTAESAVGSAVDLLQRMRELAVQSASETLSADSRNFAHEEYQELKNQVKTVAIVTEFNGISLTDNSNPTISVQVGANNTADDRIDVQMSNMNLTLSIIGASRVDSVANANISLKSLDKAVITLNSDRSVLGAAHNRLLSALGANEATATALTAAESQIMDTDYASETSSLAKSQILQSAGIASMSQARNIHRSVIALL